MKISLSLIIFLFIAADAFGQRADNWAIDNHAEIISAATPESLALKLTEPYTTDRQKARAIFRWITANIEYDMSRYTRSATSLRQAKPVSRDTTYDDRSLNERIAYNVMKKGAAVCDGYARLFQALCDYAGVRSTIISGFARSDGDRPGLRFGANHSWNAVYLDSAWHLLDATWASGYVISGTNTFVKNLDESYYLAPPERFARNHYPEEPQWALLSEPHTPTEFQHSPFKPMAFYKYGIQSFIPASGIVEAAPGDTLQLFITADPARLKRIASNSGADVTPPESLFNYAQLTNPRTVAQGRLVYTYIVPAEAPEWLNLVYNEDVVLRYRLRRRG